MSERNGTANLLAQVTAFRELKEEYNSEVAESLTTKNLQRNGIDASVTDVRGWEKVNNAAIQGRLDIPVETVIAEGKAAIAAGTIFDKKAPNICSQEELNTEQDEENDLNDDEDDDCSDDQDEAPTIDEMYGYDNSEDNDEAALDDILKIQENS